MRKININILTSILIPILLILCMINVTYRIKLTALFGVSIFLPIFLCPIGFMLAVLSYERDKTIWAEIGITLNVLVFWLPLIWILGRNL
ncbi:amino acid carrier protein [Bacillus cereus]|uniref:amino acid carrier protein n=1 Tax=Bacillus cereus TaxID=1396 RepID=UPI000BEDB338|nr:amino acid carrier protein [Bacillus cereus]PEE32450.1 amino acid carrier protein [Bacillus cereus]PET38986.1 amino acid carrier protein [Bacillus cereus]PEV73811.1 amino acid carrier protein [Bacillus cereus]PFA53771.1 amino acid carrier protein [Bacillus cereus]PFD57778.1 amino acid carrier protein [Bacillus cereus]